MGHKLTHYMTTGRDSDSYTIHFMARPWPNRFLHILHFLHFADNSQRSDKGEEYDRLWKLRTVFNKMNKTYAKFYNPFEHLAVDEVIVKFKGRVIFRQNIPPSPKKSSASKFTNSVMNQGIHMPWKCTWVETNTSPLTWLQHIQLLDIWLAELKA